MNFLRSLVLCISVLMFSYSFAQSEDNSDKKEARLFTDFIMGPYLFIDHIPYDAVMMFGSRLGCEIAPNIAVMAEYLVGQQHDEYNTLGMTHHASLEAAWFMASDGKRIRPYLYAGGGFLEFKAFTHDALGVGYFGGTGIESNLSKKVKGLLEYRYLNVSNLKLGAQHEIAVIWGVRVNF